MIVVAGLPEEPPLRRVISALDDFGLDYRVFDQTLHDEIELTFRPADGDDGLGGELLLPGEAPIALSQISGVYQRLHAAPSFGDLAGLSQDAPRLRRFNRLVELFTAFCDICDGVVLNRTAGMVTNNSKPYQAQIIGDCGFKVPRTLITSSAELARAFVTDLSREGREAIYKSASSVRSVVKVATPEDFSRFDSLRICPVQFQERVDGQDVRVHVVGESTFASAIETTGVDYRYADSRDGGDTTLSECQLPEQVRLGAVRLARSVDLPLAGIDLRRTTDGEWYCFEVNPSPAYSYYEAHTGQPIAASIARFLAGELL